MTLPMYNALPDYIKELMQGATPDDRRRLEIKGWLIANGVYERTHTTHLNEGVTVFRFAHMNVVPTDTVKEVLVAWINEHYGIEEVLWYQSRQERTITTNDRVYFHCRATHKK